VIMSDHHNERTIKYTVPVAYRGGGSLRGSKPPPEIPKF
jgi:hypothetical protein